MSYLELAKQAEARLRAVREASPANAIDAVNAVSSGRRCHVAEALPFLAMPLDVFALAGQPIEIRVAWWSETLWFVPAARDAVALTHEGVARHRVWTAAELGTVMQAAPLPTVALTTVMQARQAFDGEVVEVRQARP
jgi:hypothetical protein